MGGILCGYIVGMFSGRWVWLVGGMGMVTMNRCGVVVVVV